MAADEKNYPLPKFHFDVTVAGITGSFTEVTGLDVETEVIEYREGSSNAFHKLKMPGLTKNGNITLKRGVFPSDNEFYTWYKTINMNKVDRENVIISLKNEAHEPVVTWEITNAWPVKIQSTDLKAEGNEVAIQSMELAHEGLKITND